MPDYYRASPSEAFLRALCLYLADRGESLLSLTGITGQKRVRIHLRGLWRRHEAEETGYPRLADTIESMTDRDLQELRSIGVEEIEGDEIIVDVERLVDSLDKLSSYCGRSLKHLATLYRRRRG